MKTFSFTPKGDVKRNIRYLDRTVEFESGSFQVQQVGINPIITFQVAFENIASEMSKIEEFYLEHRKSGRFYFNYNGKQYVCQFTSDYAPTDTWGFDERGRIIGKISVELTLRVVNL